MYKILVCLLNRKNARVDIRGFKDLHYVLWNGVEWRCGQCWKLVSRRILESSKLSVQQIMNIIFDVFKMSVTSSMCANDISKFTAIQWHEYCRKICLQNLMENKEKLGGPSTIVDVVKILMFREKNRVERVMQSFCVVGFYDSSQRKCNLQYVEHRKEETLEELIIENRTKVYNIDRPMGRLPEPKRSSDMFTAL